MEEPEDVEILIENRIHKLQNRRFFLQQMQQVMKKEEDREDKGQGEDEDESELDLVERELEDLLKQKMRSQKNSLTGLSPAAKMESPEGGVYTLPPLLWSPDVQPETPEETKPRPPEETKPCPPEKPKPRPPEPQKQEQEEEDTKQIEPVDSLSRTEASTRCPSCQNVVFTQTEKFNGESAWLMCCICALLGGVVGFCFVPFCIDRVKSVRHNCPECEVTIHTYHPF